MQASTSYWKFNNLQKLYLYLKEYRLGNVMKHLRGAIKNDGQSSATSNVMLTYNLTVATSSLLITQSLMITLMIPTLN